MHLTYLRIASSSGLKFPPRHDSQLCSPIELLTATQSACGHTQSNAMTFDIVTSSHGDK